MKRLKTYLQISDLHFVGLAQGVLFDPWLRYVPWLSGFVGLHEPPLRYLKATLKRLQASEPDVELVVTGDLTACGSPDEFRSAEQYLATPGKARKWFGLNLKNWKELSIPGNHDFWPGIMFQSVGFRNSMVRKLYPQDADVTPSFVEPGGRSVVFLHLNGDADVGPFSPERAYACGSFCRAVAELEKKMLHRNPNEIRVLLLHHSVQYQGSKVNFAGTRWLPIGGALTLKHLTIDDASRAELVRFVTKFNVRVILTGHVHHPFFVGLINGSVTGLGHDVLEACCGTTTQRPLVNAGQPIPNSLIIHRLEEDDSGVLHWHSEAQTLSLSTGPAFGPPVAPAPPNTSCSIVV
jgi:Calcineurin-like phosphoesterase